MKLYTNELGNMTEMGTMPIYSNSIQNSYDDLWLTLTFITARSNISKCSYIRFYETCKRVWPEIGTVDSVDSRYLHVEWTL